MIPSSHLVIHQLSPKSSVAAEIYGQLNMALIRSIARAILAREPTLLFVLGVMFVVVQDHYK